MARSIRIAELVVAMAVVNVSGVDAQKTTVPANQLRASAEALYSQPKKAREAASLHEREATARAESDPLVVDALQRAAQLHAFAGDRVRARTVMRRAAEHALRQGDVLKSAHAYLDAAFFALEDGDVGRAFGLAKQADLLALSPLISTADRLAIVRRIDPARAQLGALDR